MLYTGFVDDFIKRHALPVAHGGDDRPHDGNEEHQGGILILGETMDELLCGFARDGNHVVVLLFPLKVTTSRRGGALTVEEPREEATMWVYALRRCPIRPVCAGTTAVRRTGCGLACRAEATTCWTWGRWGATEASSL